MSQQINLFNPLFRKQKKYFSFMAMMEALAIIVLGLALIYAYVVSQRADLNRQAAEVERQHLVQQARFQKVSAELALDQAADALASKTNAALTDISARDAVLKQLNSGVSGSGAGYSELLKAFARQTVSGLWLTGLQLEPGGQRLTIKGRAVQAELVPGYIQRLGREKALKGYSFERLRLDRLEGSTGTIPQPSGLVEFALSSGDVPALDAKSPVLNGSNSSVVVGGSNNPDGGRH